MSVIAAADVGYSNLKLAWMVVPKGEDPLTALLTSLQQASSENEAVKASSALETRISPAGVAPVADLADARSSALPGHTVNVNGVDWRAPIDFKDSQVNHRDFSSEYVKRDSWMALLLGSLAEIGEPVIDTLVLGLPCNEYYRSAGMREVVIERAKGEHKLADMNVTVKEVKVIPQPLGTFYGYTLSSEPDVAEYLMESLVLVVDPGFYSLDCVLVSEGSRIFQNTSMSTPNSVKAICDQLGARLKDRHGIPLQEGLLESKLRKNSYTVPGVGGMYNFQDDLHEVAKEVAEQSLSDIRSRLHSAEREPNVAVLTGGGASLFEPHVKDGIRVPSVLKATDSVMMNALGYLRAAC